MNEGINGPGTRTLVKTHSLREPLVLLMFELNYFYASYSMHTGHRNPRLLKNYQNFRG